MRRDTDDLNLRGAFSPMPEECRGALMDAARSVSEEKPVRRVSYRAVLIAAIIIIATIAVAIAASRLGWIDYYGDMYGITVPKAAREALTKTEPITYQVGPMTFTFKQLMTDKRIALSAADIRLTDGSEALYTSELYDAVDALTDTVRDRYKLESGVIWTDAAKRLGLPLYLVRALIEVGAEYSGGESMEDTLWNEDGTLVYFNMPLLLPDSAPNELPVTLYMAVTRYDPETGDELESWRAREAAVIPASPLMAERHYAPVGEAALGGMKLMGARAERFATGIYLTVEFTAPGDMTEEAAMDALHGIWLLDERGAKLPQGLSLSSGVTTDEFPVVAREIITSVEALPDGLIVTDGEEKFVVK